MNIKMGELARHTDEKFGVTVLRSVHGWYWVVAGSDADTTEELREVVADISRRDMPGGTSIASPGRRCGR